MERRESDILISLPVLIPVTLLPAQTPNLSFRDTLKGKSNTIWTSQISQFSALIHGSFFPSISNREDVGNHGQFGPLWVGPVGVGPSPLM